MDVREEVSLSRGNKEGDTRSTNLITLPHNSSLPDHALRLPSFWIELGGFCDLNLGGHDDWEDVGDDGE